MDRLTQIVTMRKQVVALCFISITFLTFVFPVFSESIFLRDGTIVEGDILKETDAAMRVKKKTGEVVNIPRKDIIRTLVSDAYKTKMYIMKNDGNEIAAYIVDEDNERYVCRYDLNSTFEFTIPKSEVLSASKVPFDVLSKQKHMRAQEEKMRKEAEQKAIARKQQEEYEASLSFWEKYNFIFLVGMTLQKGWLRNGDINDLFPADGFGGTANLIFSKISNGWGFDWVICRFETFGTSTGTDEGEELWISDPRTAQYEKLFNYDITSYYRADIDAYVLLTGIHIRDLYFDRTLTNVFQGLNCWYANYARLYFGFLGGYSITNAKLIDNITGDNKISITVKNKSFAYEILAGADFGGIPNFFIELRYIYLPIKFADGSSYNMGGAVVYFGFGFNTGSFRATTYGIKEY